MDFILNERFEMSNLDRLGTLFKECDFKDFRWIDPQKIVLAYWVRMKCMYGCGEYGKTATCPPNVPSFSECERFVRDYKEAVVFHFEKKVKEPEDRFAWTKKMNLRLLELEKTVFISGYEKTFLLFLDNCAICDACPGKKEKCKKPRLARPTPEALAIDVYTTVRSIGYPINVLSDFSKTMNRYAFLFIE